MPFFEKIDKVKIRKGEAGNSLPENLNAKQTNPKYPHNKIKKKQKRASFITSQEKQASLAVEASLAIPFFLYAVYMFITIIQVITLQSKIESALYETAKEMALYGYTVDKMGVDKTNKLLSLFLDEIYVKNKVVEEIGRDYLEKSAIKNGATGLSFTFSVIMEEDDAIDLIVQYRIAPKFQILPLVEIPMTNRCKIRAFTGYENNQETTCVEETVYITENGEVYHKSLACTYLKMNKICTKIVSNEEVLFEGKKYKPCEYCVGEETEGFGYVTLYGECYHSTPACSRIDRKIQAIPISEVGTRRPCSKCY